VTEKRSITAQVHEFIAPIWVRTGYAVNRVRNSIMRNGRRQRRVTFNRVKYEQFFACGGTGSERRKKYEK